MGWFGMLAQFLGQWRVGSMARSGYLLMILGSLLWVGEAVAVRSFSLLASSFIFGALAGWNWYRWKPREVPRA